VEAPFNFSGTFGVIKGPEEKKNLLRERKFKL